jgi:hypothetical protein
MIKLPYHNSVKDAEGIGMAVQKAAERAQMSPRDYAYIMTFLFEEIVNQVCKGKIVTMPGFGQWGPWAYSGGWKATKDLPPVCLPRFQASRCFRNEVMVACTPRKALNHIMSNYQMNHCQRRRVPIDSKRSCTALSAYRRCLMGMAEKNLNRAG